MGFANAIFIFPHNFFPGPYVASLFECGISGAPIALELIPSNEEHAATSPIQPLYDANDKGSLEANRALLLFALNYQGVAGAELHQSIAFNTMLQQQRSSHAPLRLLSPTEEQQALNQAQRYFPKIRGPYVRYHNVWSKRTIEGIIAEGILARKKQHPNRRLRSAPAVARKYGIRERTFSDWIKGYQKSGLLMRGETHRRAGGGRRTKLLKSTEIALYHRIRELRASGAPLTRRWLRLLAIKFVMQREGRGIALSSNWITRFMKRWRSVLRFFFFLSLHVPHLHHFLLLLHRLSSRVAEDLSRKSLQRTEAEMRLEISKFWQRVDRVRRSSCFMRNFFTYPFSNFYLRLARSIPDGCIVNMDQTGVFPSPTITRVIDHVGAQRAHVRGLPQRDKFTIFFSIAGDGTKLPPFVVFKSTSWKKWKRVWYDEATGIYYTFQRCAWTDVRNLHHYLKTILKPYLNGREAIFILDHNSTHKNPSVLDALASLHAHTTFIPPTATPFIQPLDVTVNRIFKSHYDELYKAYVLERLEEANSAGARVSGWYCLSTRSTI